jgi:ferredoxin-NADP reductase
MAKLKVEMKIAKVIKELPDTKTVRLEWPEGYDVDFKTGQFITVYWPHKPKYKRAYSLSSCALDKGYYEMTVKRDGKMGTSIVDWAEEGDSLWVIEPVGKFIPAFEPSGKHLVCIAGGSGVTPFRGFVREATRRKLETKITVLYSVRTTDDIIFKQEFCELEKANPYFNFKITCTRLSDDDMWEGRRGRIDADWIKEQIICLPDTVFYACGPNPLVEFAEDLVCDKMGVGKDQMIIEKWG